MKAYVVDVNVAVVANGRDTHADILCRIACINALIDITQNGMIVIDDSLHILSEYRKRLNPKGQPGLGDAFFKWVWEHQAVAERCERVPPHSKNSAPEDDPIFSSGSSLEGFDRADRKYVIVALKSQNSPQILNAVDTDWWNHRNALKQIGLQICFLCPRHMNAKV